jgi:hypothetical protein
MHHFVSGKRLSSSTVPVRTVNRLRQPEHLKVPLRQGTIRRTSLIVFARLLLIRQPGFIVVSLL